jgi:uncharacterized protein (TIGR02172 family)
MLERERIGVGRTADVYAWAPGWVLKLYHPWWPLVKIEYEAQVGRAVHAAGVASPAVGDIVALDGRYGLVYEHIMGPSMERVLEAEPQRLDELARTLAQLHAAMHSHTSGDLPPQRYLLEHHIDQASPVPLDGTLKQRARQVLDTLPDGSQLCHGDFHPGNVLMAPGRLTAIDWENACLGSPLADVARTLLLLETAHLHFPREQQDGDLPAGIMRFKEQYLQEYISLTRADAALIAAWRLAVAAARLHEGIAEEESYLRDLVAGRL